MTAGRGAGTGQAVVTGAAHALPAPMDQQGLWDGYFRDHYADDRVARTVWQRSGITTRRGVVDPTQEDISGWGTAARMQRFLSEALPLGKEAVSLALADAGLAPTDVGLFGVVSCTGYVTPGLDILLSRDLGMTSDVQRLHVQPSTATARSGEPTPEDLQQMVAHALFSDAAAAVVLEPAATAGATAGGARGLEVVDVVARTDVDTADHMTWDVTDLGFKMGLDPRVPDVLARHALPVVTQLLDRHGLRPADVAGWAVHPGGRKIVEVVGEELGLPEEHLAPSYDVLRDVGNCSSATVLLVLEEVRRRRDLRPGDPVVAMAFGPGLTLYATLLRAV